MDRLCALALGFCLAFGAPPALAGTEVIAINVLLEPDDALTRAAGAANERLRAAYPAGFAFDASHVPHVTVLQRYVRKSELERVIATVADVVGRSGVRGQAMTATGFYASSFAGVGMASIAVTATPELLRLQEELIAALTPFVAEGGSEAFVPEAGGGAVNDATVAYVRDFVPKASGANYKPHVTVGVGGPAVVGGLVNAPFAPLRFTVRSVSIYQLGNFGTARRRLWSFPDPQG